MTIPPNSQFLPTEAISVQGGQTASMTGVIQGNQIDHFDGGSQGAISLFNDLANPMDVDVIAK